jgi:hypothetical protein
MIVVASSHTSCRGSLFIGRSRCSSPEPPTAHIEYEFLRNHSITHLNDVNQPHVDVTSKRTLRSNRPAQHSDLRSCCPQLCLMAKRDVKNRGPQASAVFRHRFLTPEPRLRPYTSPDLECSIEQDILSGADRKHFGGCALFESIASPRDINATAQVYTTTEFVPK